MPAVNWLSVTESLLFVAGDAGLTLKQLAQVLEVEEFEAAGVIEELKERYEKEEDRGIVLIELAGTYQLATKKEHASYLKKLTEQSQPQTLSQAALETLAIIAYKQPITRAEIEDIRGVKTESALHTLSSKGLIKEAGRSESPGRPILYGTTREFLDCFGLKDVTELPPLSGELAFSDSEEMDLFFEQFEQE
ncbi:SMC-Scp complex subunit ScpB [Bacillus thermotolerans]|uniref:Segregation and condensation protein B n=1 Tax=Bacillus thermotolerans TaxID=1221996 RepID=A0A0F5HYL1_BACTR|nr:SMC-Scp complex subunit ScpB [Bacillus thermotolerans]KKB33339.1 Segregation and condensation protein B [Bacillus thermotolerans]KKB37922.1 Segregation and condensation protein B [Bacillus thermotolerans]KKB38406.1 Segregation and condensation protein B [Bacillus thermotolerans]